MMISLGELVERIVNGEEVRISLLYFDFIKSPIFIMLLLTILTDVVLGNLIAFKQRNFTSIKAVNGSFKHLGVITFTMVIVPMLSILVGNNSIKILLVLYFIFQYFISIVENLGELGVEVPKFLVRYLKLLQDEGDNYNDEY